MLCLSNGRHRLFSGIVVLAFCLSSALADVTYTLKAGDSVSQLAARFSIPQHELISRNDLKSPDAIYTGQQLRLPENAAAPVQTGKANEPQSTSVTSTATPAEIARPLTGRRLLEERARLLAARSVQRGQQIASAARAFTGSPYRRGGLSSRGIDCSGLALRALASQGINAPHNAATMFCMGKRVTYEQLQPGDLIFFNIRGRGISHVGIWVGDNKFVHATHPGRGVVVDRINRYYSRRLVGARRLH